MKNILIYSSLGADIECVRDVCSFFKYRFPKYNIKYAHYWNIINENWEENTELLIFPGGADSYYQKKLGENGCEKIRNFVENGGKYLGICAGAYFAGKYLEFAKGTSLEICERRSLGLFQGTTKGPILKSFSYEDNSGACAAKIAFFDSQVFIYYNGGGTFVEEQKNRPCEIIARYCEKDNLPAIIKCPFGKGFSILSGVHFEKDLNNVFSQLIFSRINSTKLELEINLKRLFNFL